MSQDGWALSATTSVYHAVEKLESLIWGCDVPVCSSSLTCLPFLVLEGQTGLYLHST